MSKPEKYVPKHRAPGKHKAKRDPWASVRSSVPLTGVAAAVTGVVVTTGVVSGMATGDGSNPAEATQAAAAGGAAAEIAASSVEGREAPVTRSDRRGSTDASKEAVLTGGVGVVTTHRRNLSAEDPKDIARALLGEFGFASSQFSCLDSLWTRESGWRWNADNPSSSAYGIPQALPGSKMSSAGSDWQTNPATQIKWGLGYIKGRYGTPCSAWGHSESHGWY